MIFPQKPSPVFALFALFVGLIGCAEPDAPDVPTFKPAIAVLSVDVDLGTLPFSSLLSAADSQGDDLQYLWTFDDGTSTDVDVERLWLASGTHTVSLQVTDARGSTDTTSVDIDVLPAECPESGTYEAIGQILEPDLIELSGVAHSRQNPGVLWVHNDAGNDRSLYAIDESGLVLGVFSLDISYGDWEDIAVGANAAGEPEIFVGSVGNNNRDRETLAILVVPEPEVPLGARTDGTLPFHEMVLAFPGGPFDSESLAWDPQTGDLYVLTKQAAGISILFRAEAPHDEPSIDLTYVTEFDFGAPPLPGGSATTAASISPLGDLIAFRTYSSTAYVWRRDASAPFVSAFDTEPCPIQLVPEGQGEAMDFSLDGRSLITIREGVDVLINRTNLDGPLPE
ncbi:MAG: PKD domain-containing protein [Rhodobacterales bacterium]|nr:PKD domain-containing protein [Rhodobacterales bacterium]